MKKILLVAILVLSSLSMANDQPATTGNLMNDKVSNDMMANDILDKGIMQCGSDEMMGRNMLNVFMTNMRNNPEVMKMMIEYQEKKVELMKEMAKVEPSSKKIDELSAKMSDLYSKVMTSQMNNKKDNASK